MLTLPLSQMFFLFVQYLVKVDKIIGWHLPPLFKNKLCFCGALDTPIFRLLSLSISFFIQDCGNIWYLRPCTVQCRCLNAVHFNAT